MSSQFCLPAIKTLISISAAVVLLSSGTEEGPCFNPELSHAVILAGTLLFGASHPNGLSCAAPQPWHFFLSPENDLGRLFSPPQGEQKHKGFLKDRDGAFPTEASCCSHQNSILSTLAVSPLRAVPSLSWHLFSVGRAALALHRSPAISFLEKLGAIPPAQGEVGTEVNVPVM